MDAYEILQNSTYFALKKYISIHLFLIKIQINKTGNKLNKIYVKFMKKCDPLTRQQASHSFTFFPFIFFPLYFVLEPSNTSITMISIKKKKRN